MFEQDITAGPGTGTFASHTIEILVMLAGAFLLGLWLGWVLWNRYKQAFDKLRLDYDVLQTSVTSLNAELSTFKSKVGALDKEREDLVARLAATDRENTDLQLKIATMQADMAELVTENRQLETEVILNAGEAETIEGNADLAEPTPSADPEPEINLAAITEDDTLLDTETSDADTTVIDLSVEPETSAPDTAPELPTAGAEPFVVHDDENFRFVMQDHEEAAMSLTSARSAAAPEADDDDPFSDLAFSSLTARSAPAPVATEEVADDTTAPVAFVPLQQDDLKIVEGIGPKIEELLFKAGIHTYSELAAAPVSRLKEILNEAGPRFTMHDPGTWSAQALLAANGEWENLKAYQGFLDSGKAPVKK